MDTTNTADAPLTDDQNLEYALSLRRQLITQITKGNKMPEDKDTQMVLLKTIEGIESVALGRKRIKVDEKAGAANQAAAAIVMAQILRNPAARGVFSGQSSQDREIPMLDINYPLPTLVPGELDVGTPTQSFDAFMANNPLLPIDELAE